MKGYVRTERSFLIQLDFVLERGLERLSVTGKPTYRQSGGRADRRITHIGRRHLRRR